MEENLGKKIKYFRIKSAMTQSKLAKGIISESYLSKIENGKVEPPKEIVLLLSKRLNINLYSTEWDKLFTLCDTWFQHLFRGEKEESTKLYNEIIKDLHNIASTPLFNMVELHKLRYFILIQDKQKATTQFDSLHKHQENFKEEENYYFMKFCGNYHFSRLSYNKSMDSYKRAEQHITDVSEKEKYDLFYMIALTASKLRLTYISLKYANSALHFYQNNYNLKRCAECHILLGISYQRAGELNQAMENYQLVDKIGNEIENQNISAMAKQNIGKVYSIMGNTEKAIEYYLTSYNKRNNFPIARKIIPVSSLMKEYFEKEDIDNAKKWLEKGLSLSEHLSIEDSIYVYEFKVYSNLINGIENGFEELITKKVLPFLEKRNLFYEKATYLKFLAIHHYDNRKYKLAAHYYKCASKELAKTNTEEFLGDE
ncbi:helix-turn-helix domain-containing protein [Sporosarcina sp. UB5]|uniref:helix-turn-helix domain-containing protein n=1 Tax=Sporosarcina sp. UB5 TaxID=3047463 RepID=UPI003D790EC5